jgi:predicted transcriptional regulator
LKHRRDFEIIADILKVVEKGARKTRIMYDANLSYRLLDKYLKRAVELGFICFNDNRYEATDKGRMFLEMYTRFSNKYSGLQREFKNMLVEMETLRRMCITASDAERKPVTRKKVNFPFK